MCRLLDTVSNSDHYNSSTSRIYRSQALTFVVRQRMAAPAPGADYAALREQYALQKQEELEAEEGGFVAVRWLVSWLCILYTSHLRTQAATTPFLRYRWI